MNAVSTLFCQKCRTPVPHRYLWTVGALPLAIGETLGDRYECVAPQIVLDTKPGVLPRPLTDVPSSCAPYLRLSPYRFHVPQIYAILNPEQSGLDHRLLLLEQAAIAVPSPSAAPPQLLPALQQQWSQATGLRQLSWLRQWLALWEAMAQEGATPTLLTPSLVRVDGSTVRLAELRFYHPSQSPEPTLVQLGELWLSWVPTAQATIRAELTRLGQGLQQGQLRTPEQAIALIDTALTQLGQAQTRSLHLTTLTDQGPTRERNEDACFPESGTQQRYDLTPQATPALPLAIVCDGIGGHEGGNVASMLAITTIRDRLHTVWQTAQTASTPFNFATVTTELELAICAANDAIASRNDQEQRQDRQRMGTTVVLAFAQAHELYIANLGDSRAYRITRQGCRQITLDDDVATREVRLGYLLYREAVQQPGSGSLVQALGMGPSSYLYPAVYHFITDEDCLIVLCSDGLSDNDLVDLVWASELLPVLEGQRDLATASRRLVEIANRCNGYDNVTVGLVHCQVQDPDWARLATTLTPTAAPADPRHNPPWPPEPVSPPPVPSSSPAPEAEGIPTVNLTGATAPAPPHRPSSHRGRSWLSLVIVLVGLGAIGWAVYRYVTPIQTWLQAQWGLDSNPVPSGSTPLPGSLPPDSGDPTPTPVVSAPLSVQTIVQLRSGGEIEAFPLLANLEFLTATPAPSAERPILGLVPAGSVLKVEQVQQATAAGDRWLRVLICPSPAPASPPTPTTPSAVPPPPPPGSPTSTARLLTPGAQGWVLEADVLEFAAQRVASDPSLCSIPNLGEGS